MRRILVKRVFFVVIVVGLLVAMLPSVALAAPSAQGGVWQVVAAYLQLYADVTLQTPAGQVAQRWFVEASSPVGGARYVRSFAYNAQSVKVYGAEGWVGQAAFGTSLTYLAGAALPPGTVERGHQAVQSVGHCRRWLECNGYSRAGTGRVWGWLNRTRILTTHSEDCIPYRNMPRPLGCY